MKKLVINNVLLAAYKVDISRDTIFLKVFANVPQFSKKQSEQIYHAIICAAYQQWVNGQAYLSISMKEALNLTT